MSAIPKCFALPSGAPDYSAEGSGSINRFALTFQINRAAIGDLFQFPVETDVAAVVIPMGRKKRLFAVGLLKEADCWNDGSGRRKKGHKIVAKPKYSDEQTDLTDEEFEKRNRGDVFRLDVGVEEMGGQPTAPGELEYGSAYSVQFPREEKYGGVVWYQTCCVFPRARECFECEETEFFKYHQRSSKK